MDVSVLSQGRQSIGSNADSSVEQNQELGNNYAEQDYSNKTLQNKSSGKMPVSLDDAKKAADKFNKLLEDTSTHIEYEQDKNFKYVMIMKVVDNDTHKVIKEIPSKQILDMVAQFCEMAGLLVDKKA